MTKWSAWWGLAAAWTMAGSGCETTVRDGADAGGHDVTATTGGGHGGAAGAAGAAGHASGLRATGEPCTMNAECLGGLCITSETFASLAEPDQPAEIPGGYCSSFSCSKDSPSVADCGSQGYCFDLEPLIEAPMWLCLALCETVSDCREGYLCTDAQGPADETPPLPHAACLAPELLCLLAPELPACS